MRTFPVSDVAQRGPRYDGDDYARRGAVGEHTKDTRAKALACQR